MPLDFSLVILHFNASGSLERCLESIEGLEPGPSWEAIVVDNASKEDDTLRRLRSGTRWTWIQNEKNLGFPGGMNLGLSRSQGEIVVLLPGDTCLFPDALVQLRRCFDQAPERTGIVGGRLLNPDGSPQPSCGSFPGLLSFLVRLALPGPLRKYYFRMNGGIREVDWVTGTFLSIRREAYQDIGPMDKSFFMYYEDVDWCRRARQRQWKVLYQPEAKAYHMNCYAQGPERPDWLKREIRRSQLHYFQKHRPLWEYKMLELLNKSYFKYKGWDSRG